MQLHEAGLWSGSFLAVPALMAGAGLLAGLDTLTPSPTDETAGDAFIVTPLWPVFACALSIVAVMLISLFAPASQPVAISALLGVYAVAAARLSWWQYGRVGPALTLPLILLVPVFSVLAIALLAQNPAGRQLAWPAVALAILLCAWIVQIRSSEADLGRTPRRVREALQTHFKGAPGQPVVMLRFGLALQADDEAGLRSPDASVCDQAGRQVSQILHRQFRADDRIVHEAPLQWSVICVNAGPGELAMLAERLRGQIATMRLPDAGNGWLRCSLTSGISAHCDSVAAGETGWWQAGMALQPAP